MNIKICNQTPHLVPHVLNSYFVDVHIGASFPIHAIHPHSASESQQLSRSNIAV